MVNLIFFFAFYCDWLWWGWLLPIDFVPFVRAKAIYMKYIMYLKCRGSASL
jgi:hypothetical protein